MKPIIFTFLLSITYQIPVNAQYYSPMLNANGWCVDFNDLDYDINLTLNYHLTDQEFIDGYNYMKVEYDAGEPNYLREDTLTKKIWLNSPYYENEILLYDFNLTLGDSIWLPIFLLDTQQFYVSSIDSLDLLTGTERAIYLTSLNTEIEDLLWVEGLGSLNGPLYIYDYSCSLDGYKRSGCLMCAYGQDGVQIFDGSCAKECEDECSFFIPEQIPDIITCGVNISYSNDYITVTSKNYLINNVAMYTIDGNTQVNFSNINQKEISFWKNDLGMGLRLISVKCGENTYNKLIVL